MTGEVDLAILLQAGHSGSQPRGKHCWNVPEGLCALRETPYLRAFSSNGA